MCALYLLEICQDIALITLSTEVQTLQAGLEAVNATVQANVAAIEDNAGSIEAVNSTVQANVAAIEENVAGIEAVNSTVQAL